MKTLDLNLIFNPDKEITTDYDYSTPWTEADTQKLIDNTTTDMNEMFPRIRKHHLHLIIDNKTVVRCAFSSRVLDYITVVYSIDFNINNYAGDYQFLYALKSALRSFEGKPISHSSIIAIITNIKEIIQHLHNIADDYTKCYCNTHNDDERTKLGNYIIDKCIHELRKDEVETAWLTLANITSIGAEPSLAHFHKFIEYFGMHKNTNDVFFTMYGTLSVKHDLYNYRLLNWEGRQTANGQAISLRDFAIDYDHYRYFYTPKTITNKTLVKYWKSL